MSEREWRELLLGEIRELRSAVAELQQAVATLKASAKIQSSIFGGLAGFAPLVFEKIFNR